MKKKGRVFLTKQLEPTKALKEGVFREAGPDCWSVFQGRRGLRGRPGWREVSRYRLAGDPPS